ncbi:MAG: hypothetical protein EOO74_00910 [Myxococcales bacterium]|nr:MAG: hypothetical protein EOO74_00910 [Myxococcales bacterium]
MMPDPNRALLPSLSSHSELVVVQQTELAEMVLDYESRNKYAVYGSNRQPVAYAAEQGKGLLATIMRGVMRHWRSFEIHLFTPDRQQVARASHPFRWFAFNECLQVHDARGTYLGAIQRRFAFFAKVFEVLGPTGEVLMRVDSGLFSPWSFEFKSGGQRHAVIEKKWSGFLKEMFTDADTFRLGFDNPGLRDDTRWLLIAAAIFVDLQFFEDNQGSKSFSSSSSSDE